MQRVIKSIFRSVAELLSSEAGEMLSARRKSRLLQNKR